MGQMKLENYWVGLNLQAQWGKLQIYSAQFEFVDSVLLD
jgi:hypothetical protein